VSALKALAWAVGYLWAFWGMYVLVMGLYRAQLAKRLGPVTVAMALPFLAIGYVMDLLANVLIASIVFLELPRELLVTDRLIRHTRGSHGWRAELALWICVTLLDVFDPSGRHCTDRR
jgi:hypothetical protein